MKLTLEQFEKRIKAIEEKKQWISNDIQTNKKNYKKEEFIEACEKNINLFFKCGLPYEIILEIFSYCDIKSCVNFGIWDQAILLSRTIDTPTDFETVQFFHYFKDKVSKALHQVPSHGIDSIKFLYYNNETFNTKFALHDMATSQYRGQTDVEVLKFLLERCNSDTSYIRRMANKYNKEMYNYVYNNQTPCDMQLSCHGIKKNGNPCSNKASYYGFCGIHRKTMV